MQYVEAHKALKDHPKMKKSARLLGIGHPQMIGHLLMLWWWGLDYAPDGDVTRYENADIAEGAGWEGDPAMFVDALVKAGMVGCPGWLEETEDGLLMLHDWDEYGGKVLAAQKRNTEKVREWRSRQKESHNEHDTGTRQSRKDDVTVTQPLRNADVTDKNRIDKNRSTPPIIPPTVVTVTSNGQATMAAAAARLPKVSDPILEHFEREATDMLGKVLTRKQREVINGFRNELNGQLTVEVIDYGFEAAAKYSGDKLAYVFQTIRNRLAGVTKPTHNGTGNGNGAGDYSDEVYSFDVDLTTGRRIPLSGNPRDGTLPYGAASPAEVTRIHRQKRMERRNGVPH